MELLRTCEIEDRDTWNALVVELPHYGLRQGYEWGEARRSQGWLPRRLAILRGDRCVAAVSLLVKQIPLLGHSLLYAPEGPLLLDSADERVWGVLLRAMREVAARTNAIFLRVDPKVPDSDSRIRAALVQCGFLHLPDNWTVWNSPRVVMALDLRRSEEELRRQLRRRFREYISSAPRRGVRVRPALSREEAREFYVSLATAGRQKRFPVRDRGYFERLWEEYLQPGRGVLLLAEYRGRVVGGLLGAKLGEKATMLYITLCDRSEGMHLQQGPLLYWEFIRWAKAAGCTAIDWGGSGTHFPPREGDPGFGVYRFKLGFNSCLGYLGGYYDLVFSLLSYRTFRFLERWGAALAWPVRARFNDGIPRLKALSGTVKEKARQFRVSVAQRGLRTTLYWAAFGFLRPNRFVVFANELTTHPAQWRVRKGISCELWTAEAIREWRSEREGLSPEFFQDTIDGVDTAAVICSAGEVAGLIWVYRSANASRLFHLKGQGAELNNGCVLPHYRGGGLFRDLLAYACCRLKADGYKTVYAMVHEDNAPSLRAFRGTGFREVGEITHFLMYRPKFRGDFPPAGSAR